MDTLFTHYARHLGLDDSCLVDAVDLHTDWISISKAGQQPLEEGFPMFRHKSNARQRERLGHVGFFNWHSFLDMASATGWQPLEAKLLAPWELHCYRGHRPCLKSLLVRFNRPIMSHFISGFYMIGAFKAA
jgi:hypothetical protein